jgi:hypothetical protein
LTDEETPKLRQYKMVNQTLAVGPCLLEPGASGEVSEEVVNQLRPEIQRLVGLGALALNELPASYTVKMKPKAAPVPSPTEAKTNPNRRKGTS